MQKFKELLESKKLNKMSKVELEDELDYAKGEVDALVDMMSGDDKEDSGIIEDIKGFEKRIEDIKKQLKKVK